jgi:hypothetical protein
MSLTFLRGSDTLVYFETGSSNQVIAFRADVEFCVTYLAIKALCQKIVIFSYSNCVSSTLFEYPSPYCTFIYYDFRAPKL